MSSEKESDLNDLQHLKQVSKIKHIILEKYLPAWAEILGSWNNRLCYFDCYAGPGIYESGGKRKEGSPIIAVKIAKKYLSRYRLREITITLIEKEGKQRASLKKALEKLKPYEKGLQIQVYENDAKAFVSNVLKKVPNLAPSFFMVDPYGHPLTIPILNNILQRPNTEALINFMYYRINMDAGNPRVQHNVDEMFGSDEWRQQPFLKKNPIEREIGFLNYFCEKIFADYKFSFRICYDPKDKNARFRTKYYLIHVSNHPKAVLIMKNIMFPLGDEEGLFEYSAMKMRPLFSRSPREEELEKNLVKGYSGKKVAFVRLLEETWYLPFIEKQYRSVIKKMRKEGRVSIEPVTSKTERGLKGCDLIIFPS